MMVVHVHLNWQFKIGHRFRRRGPAADGKHTQLKNNGKMKNLKEISRPRPRAHALSDSRNTHDIMPERMRHITDMGHSVFLLEYDAAREDINVDPHGTHFTFDKFPKKC